MKKFLINICCIFTFLSLNSYGNNVEKGENMRAINIQIGEKNFKGKIFDTSAGSAFIKLFPLTLNMSDLNNNEKYSYLSEKLPMNSQNVNQIKAGDLMLFGSECLVLFYENFNTSYRYTKLGYIENPELLKNVLGNKDVKIKFNL